MTISRRLGLGYAVLSGLCLLATAWLGYHEFVEEPRDFAAMGLPDVHKDTEPELFTVLVLGAVPVLLACGWWWTRRVLAPLRDLTEAASRMETHSLRQFAPRPATDNEVDALAAVLESMSRRIEASFLQMREFTLHASHELKTPLTVMRAQLETLHRERDQRPPEENRWIEQHLDEIARLAKIVDSLTLLTKVDAGLLELDCEEVNFQELVREAGEDAQFLGEAHGVRVSLEPVPAATLSGDRHRLRQLLLILVDNAVKYNRPGGELVMAASVADGAVELRITNDGGSLAADAHTRVFDRFVRGENAAGKIPGCGLGLTIARWIVTAHGGTIGLRTERAGTTTACVRLPLQRVARSRNGNASHLLNPGRSAPGAARNADVPSMEANGV